MQAAAVAAPGPEGVKEPMTAVENGAEETTPMTAVETAVVIAPARSVATEIPSSWGAVWAARIASKVLLVRGGGPWLLLAYQRGNGSAHLRFVEPRHIQSGTDSFCANSLL